MNDRRAEAASYRELFAVVARLKSIRRQGWIDRGIPVAEAESVADHTFMTACMAWLLALDDDTLDASRVLQLAIVHDLAESITGDIVPYALADIPDPSDREAFERFFSERKLATAEAARDKAAAESRAMDELLQRLPPGTSAAVRSLWDEYEQRATPEARFVKELDRLDAFLQARRYASAFPEVPVSGFTDMAVTAIDHPLIAAIRDAELEASPGDADR